MKRYEESAGAAPPAPPITRAQLDSSLADLWENLMERAVHRFGRPHPDDPPTIETFEEFKLVLKHAYEDEERHVEVELDRFVNEGGASRECE